MALIMSRRCSGRRRSGGSRARRRRSGGGGGGDGLRCKRRARRGGGSGRARRGDDFAREDLTVGANDGRVLRAARVPSSAAPTSQILPRLPRVLRHGESFPLHKVLRFARCGDPLRVDRLHAFDCCRHV